MIIISKTILREFGYRRPDAVNALNAWYTVVKEQNWTNMADLRNSFNSVDYVGNDRFVFDIKGNQYRIMAMIFFDIRTVFIRFVGTHTEYDKIDASTI